jgi:hypothetical protein
MRHRNSDADTVADHDITLDDLTAAATRFLQATGWDHEDGELVRDMVAGTAEAAAGYPPGARLRPHFDHTDEEWTLIPE